MRRDAVRQFRTVAGHRAAAAPQEEAAGISGGQEAAKTWSGAPDSPRTGVVLRDAIICHDRGGLGVRASVPGAAVRGPCRVHTARGLCARASGMHDGTPRTVARSIQLYVEFVPGGLHQRRVQLQSHLRGVQDGRWRRRRRGRGRSEHRWWKQRRPPEWRGQQWWPNRAGSCVASQHQGLRVPTGCRVLQFYSDVRQPGCQVPVPLLAAEPHADRGRLRQTAAVHRHRSLLCGAVYRLCRRVHCVVRYALRLSVRWHRTPGTVQELRRTLSRRGILQVFRDKCYNL